MLWRAKRTRYLGILAYCTSTVLGILGGKRRTRMSDYRGGGYEGVVLATRYTNGVRHSRRTVLTETGVPPARLPPPVRPGVVRTYSGEARRGSDVGDVAVLASTCPLGSIYRTLTAYPLCAWCYGCRRRLCRWGRYLRVECRGSESGAPLRAGPTP